MYLSHHVGSVTTLRDKCKWDA